MKPIVIALLGAGGLAVTVPAFSAINYQPSDEDDTSMQLEAFLKLIREGESADDYSALVGGGRFSNFSDHPYETGEFAGIRRADGRLTTAAGAYQITVTTWRDLGGADRYGSFHPAAQDQAAVDLIKRRGALVAINRGNIAEAVDRLKSEWEFFTTTRWSLQNVASTFQRFGGVIA